MAEPTQQIQTPILTKTDTLTEYQEYFDNIATFDKMLAAKYLGDIIIRLLERQPDFKSNHPDLHRSWTNLLWKSCWIALPVLKQERILELFHGHYRHMLDIPDFDLWTKLRAYLLSLMTLEERTEFKNAVIDSLRDNNEILTKEGVTKDGKELSGTLKNWLTDTIIKLGTDRIGTVELSEYLVNSENTKSLTEQSRKQLSNLLKLVEKLKIPSDEALGYEADMAVDDVDIVGTIREGRLEQYGDEAKEARKTLVSLNRKLNTVAGEEASPQPPPAPISTPKPSSAPASASAQLVKPAVTVRSDQINHLQPKDLVKIYTQNSEEQRAVSEEEKRILGQISSGEVNASRELQTAMQEHNRPRVIAWLVVLAKTGDFFTLVKADSIFIEHLKQKFGEAAISQFERQAEDPIFYSLWLQRMLRDRLQMLESDSARIGTKLANVLGRRYLKVSYIDSVSGSFKWVPIKKDKDRLTLVS
ncbi:MAG: hypothetical protein Q8Q20_03140 [bacterium]|nr:hypothetical protein [bacterium]